MSAPAPLTATDLRKEAQAHGIEPAALRAVVLVESDGEGYLPDGRIKILFERHLMWARLKERELDPLPLARAFPDLCGPTWVKGYYLGGAGEYGRLARLEAWASAHAPTHFESYKKAGYESCSWGLPQLLGENYGLAGFPDVYSLVHYMEASSLNQLEVMIRFLEGRHVKGALNAHDWGAVARVYNGEAAVPAYSKRLRQGYARARGEGY